MLSANLDQSQDRNGGELNFVLLDTPQPAPHAAASIGIFIFQNKGIGSRA
jgi:hypothetical protein